MDRDHTILDELRQMRERIEEIGITLAAHIAVEKALERRQSSRVPMVAALASCLAAGASLAMAMR